MNKEINELFEKERITINKSDKAWRGNNSEYGEYKIRHKIDIDKETGEYIITAKMIIPKNSKYILNCKVNNESPITSFLLEKENEHNILIADEKTTKTLYFD